MPNPLTGDFAAVLQVSGGTINRLLATMHQNGFTNLNLPSFPHTVWMRLGDGQAFDGVRGRAQVQIGVPRIELIHGATDRFRLQVSVRAWYRPDVGTKPLPAFIHGTVQADYRLEPIDPNCFGWRKLAADYLWVRVIPDTVRFEGTAQNEPGPGGLYVTQMSAAAASSPETLDKITRQIAFQLATRFEPTPQRLASHRFRGGAMRSLSPPIGGAAVALPIALGGEPVGQISSLNNVLLNGADFAIAVRQEYLMGLAQPVVDQVRTFTRMVTVHVSPPWPLADFDAVYHVSANAPVVEWHPYGNYAVIKLKATGSATTSSSLADATFSVEQDVVLNFDAVGEQLWLSPGSRSVRTSASGLGSGAVDKALNGAVNAAVKNMVEAACANAQPALDAMLARKQELIDQLRTLDGQAQAQVSQAEFVVDGVVLRGAIAVTMRHSPVVIFEKTPLKDGFTALESWLPGGRIDKLEWTWSWRGNSAPGGAATHDDRFLLRRPPGQSGRWGLAVALQSPLPGIDGFGTVCLRIRGVQVDAVTGALVPVGSTRRCTRFGFNIAVGLGDGRSRLFLRDMPELSQDVPFPQLAVRAAERAGSARTAPNTLVLYQGENQELDSVESLMRGLGQVRREDAGLVVLVLFREGVLERAGSDRIAEIQRYGQEMGLLTLVNEDVGGGWARALALEPEGGRLEWRLLSPGGGVTWMHQGRLGPERLAEALDHYLIPSPPPEPKPYALAVSVGTQLSAVALHPGFAQRIEQAHCPPSPSLGRLGLGGSVIAFVQAGSPASAAQLRQLAGRYTGADAEGPEVLVIVDGAGEETVAELQNEVGVDFAALADPGGVIADRFGVGVWPTTLSVDGGGRVTAIETGLALEPRRARRSERENKEAA